MPKSKTKGVKYWKKKAWDEFSKYVRLRDALATTGDPAWCKCITCGKIKPAFGVGCIQAGHFVPSRCNAILFDEECTNGQCYGCNCGQGGMWVEYEQAMIEKYGTEKTEELKLHKHKVVKYTESDLEEIRDNYKQKLKDLKGD